MPNSLQSASTITELASVGARTKHPVRPDALRGSWRPPRHPPPLARSVRRLLTASALSSALVLASCWVGDPFVQAEAEPLDAGSTSSARLPGEPATAPDARIPAPPTPAPEAESIGFSATHDGRLVAFGIQTGEIHAEIPLGNEVIDLQWLPKACRLMARVTGQAASQRVFSFALRRAPSKDLEFSLEGASEELWGPTQILGVEGSPLQVSAQPSAEALWLISGEPAPSWQRVDSALSPLSGRAAWPAPLDWSALPGGSVVALLGSGEHSEIAVATLSAGAPQIERRPLPYAVALAAEGGRVWVWRLAAEAATIHTLDLPSFTLTGQAGQFPSSRPRALVASASRLAAYQVDPDGAVRILIQEPGATRTRRFADAASSANRPLALQGDYLWYAGASSVSRLHLPELSARSNFNGAELRAPLVVPPVKTMRCIR